MKKIVSLLISLCLLLCPFTVMAEETFIEINPLEYDEYTYEETIFISGFANKYVTLGLYYPEEAGGSAKYIMTYSPDELSEGIEIALGEQSRLWPEGVWTIIVQSGDVSESLEFTLSETVDRTEDDFDDGLNPDDEPTEKPTKKPTTGGGNSVTAIIPDTTELSLTEGESTKVNITTSASSLTLEIDDEDVIAASISGKTVIVTALKKGESQLWVKTGNNYASIRVVVAAAPIKDEEPTDESTDEPTEEPTEKETENPFTDLPASHWAKDSILTLYEKGIINGMDEDTFAPDDFVTRAQFVTMLQKAFKLEPKFPLSPFDDVKATDWYYTAVIAAYDNGIATGYGGMFNPNSLVTRQDMATFAYRAAVHSGKSFSLGNVTNFDDHASISAYAAEAVYSMRSKGIINGMTSTTFEPLGNATRAQAAHIIAKLLELN
ncbi:MAG: S-layer homology domain-containing protein [Clostridia bacterium]|nr:S-layer homology domain-containing protein [Clostridia bacterium]